MTDVKPIKILVLVDVQNDFITGSLANKDAQRVLPNIVEKVKSFDGDYIIATLDTHHKDYLSTKEGQALPVVHCIQGTNGWMPPKELDEAYKEKEKHLVFIKKPTFGSVEGMDGDSSVPEVIMNLKKDHKERPFEIEICGFVSEICVLHNAIILKAFCYDFANITVDATCCAGLTPEKHEAALSVMESGQIKVKR